MANGMIGPGRRYHTMDGLRGAAAIFVAIHHFGNFGSHVFYSGYLAVDFFFGLSGFVLARAYEGRLAAGLTPGGFFRLRLLRLYPLYLIGCLIGFAILVAGIAPNDAAVPTPLVSIAPALLALPSPWTILLYPLNAPAWSLFFEMLANIAFAAILYRLATRWIAAVGLASLAGYYLMMRATGVDAFGTIWPHFAGGLFRVATSFVLGLLVARVAPAASTPGRRTSWLMLLAFVAILLPLGFSPTRRMDVLFVAIIVPVTLWFAARFELPARCERVCEALGDLSYPLYATHYPLLFLWHTIARRLALEPQAECLSFLLIATGVAIALVEVDARIRRRLGGLLAIRRSALPQRL